MARLRLKELVERLEQKEKFNLHMLEGLTGIPYTTLMRYRDGETAGIRFRHIDLLCKHLKCTVGQLIETEKLD